MAATHSSSNLIVYRGRQVTFSEVHGIAAQLLGGHLRPDAAIVVHGSAPVRVDPSVGSHPDPRVGTVRVLHLGIPGSSDGVLTDLSRTLLRKRLGFPEDIADDAWTHFGQVPAEAFGLGLSELSGPVAVLSVADEHSPRGSYSIFAAGRRVWSASYKPGQSYVTWDGNELHIEAMSAEDTPPMEGSWSEFPAHGLRLLFSEPLVLKKNEIAGLLPSLWRASRPPTEGSDGMWLVENGRFVNLGRKLSSEDWDEFVASF